VTREAPGGLDEQIRAAAERVKAAGQSPPRYARDPVNMPAIRIWTDAMGDTNPLYVDAAIAARSVHGGLVAPPAMVQVWTMPGLRTERVNDPAQASADPLGEMMAVLDEAGFTSVVATNCDQAYHRYLRHGELLSMRTELTDVTGPKHTALGDGWFVTTRNVWYSGTEPVAEMDWRVLKFRPGVSTPAGDVLASGGQGPPDPTVPSARAGKPAVAAGSLSPAGAVSGPIMRPPISPDTEFFWAGTRLHQLRIQRCGSCGSLRHPPGPACLSCGSVAGAPEVVPRASSSKPDYQVAAGTGTVYSYVVHHHPPVPGKNLPIVVALVELTEGVRMLGELTGTDPDKVEIGMPVRVSFDRIDDELTMPVWKPAEPGTLPELAIEVTPTVVVSTALATRDFYPAHHDRDIAVRRGNKDIFLNILTTTGLVQRYVTDWAGPDAIVRGVSIRLGVPCYAHDTLTFSGQVADVAGGSGGSSPRASTASGERVVSVTGRCSLGDHVTGTVRIGSGGAS
jgi:uncharacterized protein